MYGFLKCVAQAVVENGIEGLLGMVPGGPYIYKVGNAALEKYRKEKKDADQRAEIQQLAQVTFEQVRAEVPQLVRETLAENGVEAQPAQVAALELWLSAVPEATRTSLKRKEDPSGRSVPDNFAVRTAEDVLKLLPPQPPRFAPGAALPGKPGWVLDRPLGVGGYGEVWLARHTRLSGLSGAVKFCHGEQGKELQHEATIIDRLLGDAKHPSIVPLTDANLDGETPWLMYEYVSGGTLADWIHSLSGMSAERRQLQVIAALKQLAEAVGFFHRLDPPIVHRDLKPSNILLNKANKKLQITDFGIGAVTARATLLTESRGQSTKGGRLLTEMRGSHTPLYASPQQKVGADPDPRDDVHALGVIAYQMFTGNLTTGPGRDMDDDLRDSGASDGLIELLGKCVAQKAERRPKDAAEFAERLAGVVRTEVASPTVAPPASAVSPPVVATVPPVPVAPPAPAIRKPGEEVDYPSPGGLTFCWIPPGTAMLGSPAWERERSNEKEHQYSTKGFWLGKHPVTQAEWQMVMGYNPSQCRVGGVAWSLVQGLDTSRFPVENVSWEECRKFLEQLNGMGRVLEEVYGKSVEEVFGKVGKIRLPDEDAWEYACRGGLGNLQPFYWGNELNGTQANMNGKHPYGTDTQGPYLERPTPVGTYAAKFPHPWGLWDMHGNVWELCNGPAEQAADLICCGGSCLEPGSHCRAACRATGELGNGAMVGFRLFLPLE